MANEAAPTRRRVGQHGSRQAPKAHPVALAGTAALVGLLFLEHLAGGGGMLAVALGFGAVWSAATAITLSARPSAFSNAGLAAPAGLFAIALCALMLALTPFSPDGPHPLWAYVSATPASAIDRGAAVVQLLQLLVAAGAFLLGRAVGADDDRARRFFRMLGIGALLFGLWAFFSHIADPAGVFGMRRPVVFGRRLAAAFGSPNTAGAVFGSVAVLSAAWLIDAIKRSGRDSLLTRAALPAVCLLVCLTDLALTASRGAMLATAAAFVLLILWQALAGGWRWSPAIGLAAATAAAGAVALMLPGLAMVLGRTADVSADAASRGELFSLHWGAAQAAPWTGYGLGGFDRVHQMLLSARNFRGMFDIHAAHNVYLQWIEEGGWLGALAMFLCIAVILAQIVRGTFRRRRMTLWMRAAVAASAVLLIQGLTDYALQIPSVQLLWACILGVAHAVATKPERTGAPRIAAPALASGATAAAVAILCALGALACTGVLPATGGLNWLPFTPAHALSANRALDRAWPTRDPAALAESRRSTLREIALSPASGAGWLRLSILDAEAAGGRLDAAAAKDLERSYTVAPLDARLLQQRVRFAFDHWSELTPQMRTATLRQMELAWPIPEQRGRMMQALPQVEKEGARIAMGMALTSLRFKARVEARAARAAEVARGPAAE